MTGGSKAAAISETPGFRTASRFAQLQVFALLVVLIIPAVLQVVRLSALTSSDIWLNLSAGNCILANRAVPHSLTGSQSAELSWVDTSWLFDVLTATAVKVSGLRGLVWLDAIFGLAIAVALFVLARGARRGFSTGALLTAIALYLIAGTTFRSSVASVLLFAVLLTLITLARSAGSSRLLFWTPPLFVLWANLDIQFVYGLGTVIVFMAAETIGHLPWSSVAARFVSRSQISLRKTAAVTTACIAATLVNPYGYRLWAAALRSVSLFAADLYFPEMHALRFRQPQDYALLLLVMTAFFAIGHRHARDLFAVLLLTASSIVSFHLQRDAWLVVLVAIAVLSRALDATDSSEARGLDPPAAAWVLPATTAAAFVVLIGAFVLRVPSGRDLLMAKVSEKFPVRACNYIRQHALPKPLFNHYDWGGLPHLVSARIPGRD